MVFIFGIFWAGRVGVKAISSIAFLKKNKQNENSPKCWQERKYKMVTKLHLQDINKVQIEYLSKLKQDWQRPFSRLAQEPYYQPLAGNVERPKDEVLFGF